LPTKKCCPKQQKKCHFEKMVTWTEKLKQNLHFLLNSLGTTNFNVGQKSRFYSKVKILVKIKIAKKKNEILCWKWKSRNSINNFRQKSHFWAKSTILAKNHNLANNHNFGQKYILAINQNFSQKSKLWLKINIWPKKAI